MLTQENRNRHQQVRTGLKRGYPTDVKDEEWRLIAPLLSKQAKTGRPCKTDLRTVINALRYMVRSGCEWRMLPNDFPPYQTVYYWFRRLMRRMLFRTIHNLALMLDRLCNEREVLPSAGVVDSCLDMGDHIPTRSLPFFRARLLLSTLLNSVTQLPAP